MGYSDTGLHPVLFPPLPGHPADPRQAGAAVAAAGEHQPARSGWTWRRPAAGKCRGQADGESVMGKLRSLLAGVFAAGLLAAPAFAQEGELPNEKWSFESL